MQDLRATHKAVTQCTVGTMKPRACAVVSAGAGAGAVHQPIA